MKKFKYNTMNTNTSDMFLLTTMGFVFEKDNWVQFIKEKNIQKVILIRLVKKNGPTNWVRAESEVLAEITKNKYYSQNEKENLTKAVSTIVSLLTLLKQLYIETEYHELLEDESEIKKTAYIANIIVQQSLEGIIDIARGERILVSSFFKVAHYFPEKIVECGLSNFTRHEFVPIITPFLNPDPDQRQKTTYKDILSQFLPSKIVEFSKIYQSIIFQSKDIEKNLPDLASSHLKNRLSNLANDEPGKPKQLISSEAPDDKRKSTYQLSEYGEFVLFLTYLRKKYIIKENVKDRWVTRVEKTFDNIIFSDFECRLLYQPFQN